MSRLVITALTVALLAVPFVSSPAAAAPKCQGYKATIVGNDKANVIRGTNKRDVIVAKGGADKIYGRGGKDVICAGAGKDKVYGGNGVDRIFGGDKNDKLWGGAGWDLLDGGKGTDACYTQANGGKKVRCEEADIEVTVEAPATAVGKVGPEGTFNVTITTRNVGAKPASTVDVDVDYAEGLVTCDDSSVPDTLGYALLVPGQYKWTSFPIDCSPPDANTGQVVIKATGTTQSAEPELDNNDDQAVITIIK